MRATPSPDGSSCLDDRENGKGGKSSRTFQYRSLAAMENTLETETRAAVAMGDCDLQLVFLDVPGHIIDEFCANAEIENRHCIKYFNKREGIIELVLPFQLHETSAVVGEDMLKQALERAKMLELLDNIRRTQVRDDVEQEGKEADCAFAWASQKWPLIVLEAGASESGRDLLGDCRWWLERGRGAVRAVVLFDASPPRIHITAYAIGPRPGTVDKRQGEIAAELKDGEWAFVNEGPITIPFATVFGRPADALVGENDIELRCQDFVDSARRLKSIFLGTAFMAESPSRTFTPEPPGEADQVINLENLPLRKRPRR